MANRIDIVILTIRAATNTYGRPTCIYPQSQAENTFQLVYVTATARESHGAHYMLQRQARRKPIIFASSERSQKKLANKDG